MTFPAVLHKQICAKVTVLAAPDRVDMVAVALHQIIFKKEILAIQTPVMGLTCLVTAKPGEIQCVDIDLGKIGL